MFTTLHIILLFGFVGVTSLLMLITVANRLRMRKVMLTWRTGRLFGLPVLPTVFIAMVLVFLVFALTTDRNIHPSIFFGYLTGGAFWLTSVMLSSAIMITEVGISRTMSRVGEAVAWGQVTDYFEAPHGNQLYYVFLYVDDLGTRQRLELLVPQKHQARFQQIVRAKLDARMEFGIQQAFGKKALEG